MRKMWALALSLVVAVVSTASLAVFTGQKTKPEPTVPVVVFATAVGDRETIQGDQIKVVHYPASLAPEGAVSDPNQVIGKVPKYPSVQGQVVLSPLLLDDKLKNGIRAGMVEVGVPVNLITSSGVLKVGDVVDVAVAPSGGLGGQKPTEARILYQGLRVMALKNQQGQDVQAIKKDDTLATAAPGDSIPAVATLEATPEQAKDLFLSTQQGPIALFVDPWIDPTNKEATKR